MPERKYDLRRGLLELVTIVGGILLAFSIDAGWEKYQEVREARTTLIGLQDEFEFHRSELTRHGERWKEVRSQVGRLLAAAGEPAPPPPVVMDTLVLAAVSATSFDPRTGALDALIASGQLDLIEDEALRIKLAAWEGVVEEVRDNEMAMRDFVLGTFIPYLGRRGVPLSRSRALMRVRGLLGEQGEFTEWPGPLPSDAEAARAYHAMLSDPEFETLLAERYTWINVGEFEDAIRFVDELLVLIQRSLGT